MPKFEIDVDDFTESIFYKMEEISESGESHKCIVTAININEAAKVIASKLHNFIASQLNPYYEEN